MNKLVTTPPWLLRWGRILSIALGLLFASLFLPWQQFSLGQGRIVGLDPNERSQDVHAPLTGIVQSWYVQEGQWVEKGAPLVLLSDTDPFFFGRLELRKKAASQALESAQLALSTARINERRQHSLHTQGLAALKDWEKQRILVAKLSIEVNKAQAELTRAQQELARQGAQEVLAPRSGWVVRVQSGSGAQIVKQGDTLLTLVPKPAHLGAEIWVDANDAALIPIGSPARLEFAGWPAMQIPGWPSVAVGTFRARVRLVDAIAGPHGKFRVILEPAEPWPSELFVKQGARASGFINIATVSLGWEFWRRFNGMPPSSPLMEEEVKEFVKRLEKPQGKAQ